MTNKPTPKSSSVSKSIKSNEIQEITVDSGVVQAIAYASQTSHEGHIPSAEECERYEKLHPGTLECFLDYADRQQHSDNTDRRFCRWFEALAQLLGLATLAGLVAFAGYLVLQHPDNNRVIAFASLLLAPPIMAVVKRLFQKE